MSIMLVRGPDEIVPAPISDVSHVLHSEVIVSLLDSAASAGRTLSIRACESDRELLDVLAKIQHQPPEFLLLDPGAGLRDPAVCEALRCIAVPHIEIHDDACAALEPELREPSSTRVAVVHGYQAQGYTLAMAQALEYLGCAECESHYHVGT